MAYSLIDGGLPEEGILSWTSFFGMYTISAHLIFIPCQQWSLHRFVPIVIEIKMMVRIAHQVGTRLRCLVFHRWLHQTSSMFGFAH